MRHPFYSRLLEEKEFLLEKKEKIYVIIRSILDALKNDPKWLNSREKKDFFALAKSLLQDFALLEERRLVPAIDKLDHLLERLNTSIAELQLIGWSHAEKRLYLSFLTRLTSSFVLRKEAILKTVASLYLNARGAQQTDPDLDNKIFILAENIDKLESLQVLYARFNRLSELPQGLFQLNNLKELGVEYNQITHLPDELGKLASLEELGLDRNNLIKLPDSVGHLLNLRILSLDGNKILMLPKTITQLKNLKILGVNHNWLLELPAVNEMPKGMILGVNDNLAELSRTLTTLYDKGKKAVKDFVRKPVLKAEKISENKKKAR